MFLSTGNRGDRQELSFWRGKFIKGVLELGKMKDILFIDKDSTLDEFREGAVGLYPNTKSFLENERDKGRELYVATTANEKGKVHLEDVMGLFEEYFGSELLNSGNQSLYIARDGKIRNVCDDYTKKMDLESEQKQADLWEEAHDRKDLLDSHPYGSEEKKSVQREICEFFDYWRQLLHKETGTPLDKSQRYMNPFIDGMHMKDLYLARRRISPCDYDALRCVLVGDYGDSANSDPHTPLVRISNTVREGNWNIVANILNQLYKAESTAPADTFDELYNGATPSDSAFWQGIHEEVAEARQIELNGKKYVIGYPVSEQFKGRQRVVLCP